MVETGIPAQKTTDIEQTYQKDVSLLPSSELIDLIDSAGLSNTFQFYQSEVIQAQMATVA